MEISFIIPVYNGEKSIQSCVQSIQEWDKYTDAEIEILIIDDGSTDGTGRLCDDMAEKDGCIKVFHIANSGQGIARNHGLQAATGTYVCFADADDRVDAGQIAELLKKANQVQADVIMGGYIRIKDGQQESIHLPGEGFMKRDGSKEEKKLYHAVKTGSAFGYLWNKLYCRKFLEQNHLQLDDIRKIYMEDLLFNLKLWSKQPRWYCMDVLPYCYEASDTSTTRKAEPEIHKKNVKMIQALYEYLMEQGTLTENLDMIVPVIMRTFCWSLVKNIAYEGKSTTQIRTRAEAFMKEACIQKTLHEKGAAKSLLLLPSRLQTCFYVVCLLLLKWNMSRLTAVMFSCLYPFMKRYIVATLK